VFFGACYNDIIAHLTKKGGGHYDREDKSTSTVPLNIEQRFRNVQGRICDNNCNACPLCDNN